MLNLVMTFLGLFFAVTGTVCAVQGDLIEGAIWTVGGALLTGLMMIERKLCNA